MPSLQIRDLPDDVYQALAFCAQQEHRSLALQAVAELRRIPTLTACDSQIRVTNNSQGEQGLPLTEHPWQVSLV
jgi:plasmid stability protein